MNPDPTIQRGIDRMTQKAAARREVVAGLRQSGKTFKEIGLHLGVSRTRARHLYVTWLERLNG